MRCFRISPQLLWVENNNLRILKSGLVLGRVRL